MVAGCALAAGLGAGPALLLGLCSAGIWVGVRLSRRPPPDRIEPTRVGEPWRQRVSSALAARSRFERGVRTKPGPLRDQLREVGHRLDQAVAECWEVAQRGDRVDAALAEMDRPRIRSQLDELARSGDPAAIGPSLGAQLGSAERLAKLSSDTHDQLRRLNAQMEQAVAQAIEVSAQSTGAATLGPLGSDLDDLVMELQSLRKALQETGLA